MGTAIGWGSLVVTCNVFHHSPVFRVGGDEFVVILQNEDYESRVELLDLLNHRSETRKDEIGSTIAVGIADFREGEDDSFLKVFTRADTAMYLRKTEMKRQTQKS